MRLCMHEGEFLPRTYDALSTRYSWAEVQRIRTAVFVIEDEREDFSRWHQKNHERVAKLLSAQQAQPRSPDGKLVSLKDYKTELDGNRQGLENARADLQAHRGAVARGLGAEDGLLPLDQVEFIEEVAAVHEAKVDILESAIASLAMPDDASLQGDASS